MLTIHLSSFSNLRTLLSNKFRFSKVTSIKYIFLKHVRHVLSTFTNVNDKKETPNRYLHILAVHS